MPEYNLPEPGPESLKNKAPKKPSQVERLKARIAELEAEIEVLKNPPKRIPKYETEPSIDSLLWKQLRDLDDNGNKSCRHCGRRLLEKANFEPKSDYCKDCD
jgi:hypothetical protein